MYWFLLAALALAALGGLMLNSNLRALERRALAIEEELLRSTGETRRAHVRLDNHQRQIEALAKDIGWTDDRAHTKVLTGPLPSLAKRDEPR